MRFKNSLWNTDCIFHTKTNKTRPAFDRDKPKNLDFGLLLWTWNDLVLPTGPLTSLFIRLLKAFFDNVILEHGEVPYVLSLTVHLDFLLNRSF